MGYTNCVIPYVSHLSRENAMNLKSMSIEKLTVLRGQVESALSAKVTQEPATLKLNLRSYPAITEEVKASGRWEQWLRNIEIPTTQPRPGRVVA